MLPYRYPACRWRTLNPQLDPLLIACWNAQRPCESRHPRWSEIDGRLWMPFRRRLILVLVPMNVGLLEPYLYRQHEFMLMWLVMLGVSIRSHLPPFVVPAPVRHESLDVNESR